ncbi:uncharacterized protein DUF4395 [Halopolyspora algeriensis]|uniref:Uncharacterized protein DUF4395 n=1 Tax=Halopolyspora algeriensis TaxID=1500506 RepID=A0A368W4R1_9ACTN|nr:DUF4395 domain-containing protein [Halopolyspora algeriensis]RCW47040.1 uncharacterized protein DUF4395 [Halopolyspora algeriensis]TQM48127.1 uncharacterized protein DUF4395 [Halopolyspora algeriensis]
MSAATLDPRGIRFTAWITSVILALGLITGSWRILAAQTALFALCAFIGLKLNPWGHVYQRAVQPRLAPVPEGEQEAPAPVRFSQGVGFVFALVATVGYAAEWTALGVVANAFALVAALLNAAFGFCLGCRMYLVIRRFAPAASGIR